jgi:hypothetical protein
VTYRRVITCWEKKLVTSSSLRRGIHHVDQLLLQLGDEAGSIEV